MVQEQIKKLDNDKSIKKEIQQYKKLLYGKTSESCKSCKYKSLEEMKKQLFNELYNMYSEEELDFLKEKSKVMVLDIKENMSVGIPVWTALNIAILSLIINVSGGDNIWCVYLFLFLIILSIFFRKDNTLERIGFYNMILELIEMIEKKKHTFNNTLLET